MCVRVLCVSFCIADGAARENAPLPRIAGVPVDRRVIYQRPVGENLTREPCVKHLYIYGEKTKVKRIGRRKKKARARVTN